MVHWNRMRVRELLTRRTFALFVLTFVGAVAISQGRTEGKNRAWPRLTSVASGELPITEASALAVTDAGILAVGDRSSMVVRLAAEGSGDETQVLGSFDVGPAIHERFAVCASAAGDVCKNQLRDLTTQWEGIQGDGRGRVFLLQETTRSIFVMSVEGRKVEAVIGLAMAAETRKAKKTKGADSAEGFLLLKNGHVLVARERAPTVLIEFGPKGDAPIGLSAATRLASGDAFTLPTALAPGGRVVYEALHTWTLETTKGCDVSEIASDEQGRLYTLSESCSTLRRYGSLVPTAETAPAELGWRLPKKVRNAEGLAVLEDGRFLVATDQKSAKPSLHLLQAE